MVISRTYDSQLINRVANDPQVIVGAGGSVDEYLDFANAVEQTQRYCFLTNDAQDAVTLYEFMGPGIWEGHIMMAPSCRGRQAITTGKAMIDWMWDHGAVVIWGQVKVDNVRARWFSRQCGLLAAGWGHNEELGLMEYFRVYKPQ